jgi:peptidoglycan/LPS O-acetylase OafA/YrhL
MNATELSVPTAPTRAPAPRAGNYLPALDGFRAVAIAFVMAGHLTRFSFIPGGFGVTLFFFISGLLITRLLLDELDRSGRINLLQFYTRRFLRLAPALLTMVTLVTGSFLLAGAKTPPTDVLAVIFYLANYYRIFIGFTLPFLLMWSLAVEEHYYLIYPSVLRALMRSGRPLLILGALTIAALIWRTVLIKVIHVSDNYTNMATDTRFDSILYGAIMAIWMKRAPESPLLRWLTSAPAVAIGFALLLISFLLKGVLLRETIRYSLQGLALMPVVVAFTFSDGSPLYRAGRALLGSPPMVLVGKLSYSLYLWHYLMIDLVRWRWPHMKFATAIALELTLAVGASCLSYFLIERAFLGLRRHFGSHAR